ncbi:hypothetical protein LTR91_016767 [Friedmanniomyces endolithicus]|uniref:Uncharacterized protein n=1 Tax=Friedmanniomyces endolithicus TaxID=329885 RepID=A0AAN6K7V0_9PEZI|nr:hypothetical protein LTR94_007627 [Friedmanniomyces endolithicus]KAK0782041.1 hypothetical protein LTR59_012299 [Friedmanniomyces endolithicus]KAK0800557.1 hypothetical protein LTR38_007158 [Friedmanniomyces endolithicus]KAK0809902.1 hypothetical protein LTR75_005759 [Friedmanniomyces endolithicus]KAK0837454.1 hypothetical protein LTR03_012776 [Friedmanniomyces endolithicus]
MMNAAKKVFEYAKKAFGLVCSGLRKVKTHVQKHPWECACIAFQVAMIILAAGAGLVVTTALGLLGFSSIGPVAGSAAAAFQSLNGATAGFSLLQSAAMGGTAVFVIIVATLFAGAAVVTEFFKRRGGA